MLFLQLNTGDKWYQGRARELNFKMAAFTDLNVVWSGAEKFGKRVEMAYDLGYERIACNVITEPTVKKKKGPKEPNIANPPDIKVLPAETST